MTGLLLENLRLSGYLDSRPAPADEKVRRLIRRLHLSATDAEVLMGMLRQMEWKMKRIG
jgi:tRNA C32,U32 (ribose-2'-O)-methylase TrmJ